MTVTQKSFTEKLKKTGAFEKEQKLAVAVSGGGDSMALAFLLAGFCEKHGIALHVLTVDHGLRKASAKEAKQVAAWTREWPAARPKILKWMGEKPKTKIQEAARDARYRLMSDYCRKQGIGYLFLGHHADDQMETFLFRLAKGSGLDGLTGMQVLQEREGPALVRPLLDVSHDDLIAFCRKNKIDWIEDPSNRDDKYARVRLRQSSGALAREGLTAERISTLGKRFERIRNALDQLTDKEEKTLILKATTERIEIDLTKFLALPKEIGLRILQRAVIRLGRARAYPPKLQKLEEIVDGIFDTQSFRAVSLGGCIIRRRKTRNLLEIVCE